MNLANPTSLAVAPGRWFAARLLPLLLAGCSILPSSFTDGFIRFALPRGTGNASDIHYAWLGRTEVTVLDYCRFLDATALRVDHPQVVLRQGRHIPRRGQARMPVAHVSLADAEAYCSWLSRELERPARLPTHSEWAEAAKAGQRHAAYPWGWGRPKGHARFAAAAPAPVARYPANALGFHDLAGNLFEWCAPEPEARASDSPCFALGGSWAETDPSYLRIDRATPFPCSYRDADVGFRVLLEEVR